MRKPAIYRLKKIKSLLEKLRVEEESGQGTMEYSLITGAILLGGGVSWPFFVKLLDALHDYYLSIYWILQAPLP